MSLVAKGSQLEVVGATPTNDHLLSSIWPIIAYICLVTLFIFAKSKRKSIVGRLKNAMMRSKDTTVFAVRKHSDGSKSLWLAEDASKRWGEVFILLCTPFWIFLMLGVIVPFKLYEHFTELEYLLVGLVSALPFVLTPLVIVGKADREKPLKDRYWLKANLWLIIFSYVGNYFLTHYFFTILGASYTFPSWTMNNVPHATFLLAHCCFLFYHVASNITLRRVRHFVADLPHTTRVIVEGAWVLAFGYLVAYLETLAISNFPYYDFVDRAAMYKVGSLFYAMYFIVSFPMFLRIDENINDKWDLRRVALDALAASMLVIIILDLWRLLLGPIVSIPASKERMQSGLVWFNKPVKRFVLSTSM